MHIYIQFLQVIKSNIKREANKRKRLNKKRRLSAQSDAKSKPGGNDVIEVIEIDDGRSTCSSDDEYDGVVLKSKKK
jgi:hypothetical protein